MQWYTVVYVKIYEIIRNEVSWKFTYARIIVGFRNF
jgi:hypothetical protein